MEETIYSMNEEDYQRKVLEDFFQEVVSRKERNQEGGLQASIVLLKEKMGAKVCEERGLAPHPHSHMNLIRYMNGREDFLSISQMRDYSLYQEEKNELSKNGLDGRIISGDNEFKLVMFGEDVILSDFQKQVVSDILDICKEIRDQHIYQSVSVGFSTEEASMEYDELTDDRIQQLKEELGISYQK